jgi:asparagine synthase (glutamine-hydrolysing)
MYGVENRHPYMDRRVVEFSFSIPYEQKQPSGPYKALTRRAFRGMVPESIRTRLSNANFAILASRGLSKAWSAIEGLLVNSWLVGMGYANPDQLKHSLHRCREHSSFVGRIYECDGGLWSSLDTFVTLELWLRCHSVEIAC